MAEEAQAPVEGAQDGSGVQRVKVGDREFDPTELDALVSKGQDYTRKTQELADQRRQLQSDQEELGSLRQLNDLWKVNPQAVVQTLAQQAGVQIGSNKPEVPDDWETWTANEKRLYGELQGANATIAKAQGTLESVQRFMGEVAQKDRISGQAGVAQNKLKADLGIDVTRDELMEAVRKTGINDPEAAWLKENSTALLKAATARATSQAVLDKPNTPDAGSQTFNPFKGDVTNTDEMLEMFRKGFVLSPEAAAEYERRFGTKPPG